MSNNLNGILRASPYAILSTLSENCDQNISKAVKNNVRIIVPCGHLESIEKNFPDNNKCHTCARKISFLAVDSRLVSKQADGSNIEIISKEVFAILHDKLDLFKELLQKYPALVNKGTYKSSYFNPRTKKQEDRVFSLVAMAVKFGKLNPLEYLVKSGADIKGLYRYNDNLLHIAAETPGNLDVIKYLIINQDFDPQAQDIQGYNALTLASGLKNNSSVISYLFKFYDPMENDFAFHPLELAIKNENIEAVRFFIKEDNELLKRPLSNCLYPIEYAAQKSNSKTILFVLGKLTTLESCANCTNKENLIYHLLYKACKDAATDSKNANKLLNLTKKHIQSLDINELDNLKKIINDCHAKITPIHLACMGIKRMGGNRLPMACMSMDWMRINSSDNHLKFIELLLGNGADIFSKDADGKTALEIFIEQKYPINIIKQFFKKLNSISLDLQIIDQKCVAEIDNSLVSLAEKYGNTALSEYINKQGIKTNFNDTNIAESAENNENIKLLEQGIKSDFNSANSALLNESRDPTIKKVKFNESNEYNPDKSFDVPDDVADS